MPVVILLSSSHNSDNLSVNDELTLEEVSFKSLDNDVSTRDTLNDLLGEGDKTDQLFASQLLSTPSNSPSKSPLKPSNYNLSKCHESVVNNYCRILDFNVAGGLRSWRRFLF